MKNFKFEEFYKKKLNLKNFMKNFKYEEFYEKLNLNSKMKHFLKIFIYS